MGPVPDCAMAFGQQAGPPATSRQVRDLLELLQAAGHLDFRDARGPMGFTQRQAAGKFTRDEADTFIAQLQAEAEAGSDEGDAPPSTTPASGSARPPRLTRLEQQLRAVPAEALAAELQRRGWAVMEP
jgi:hypothetical protein